MGNREDYQIPDWVVKDYNSRVSQEDRLLLDVTGDYTEEQFEGISSSRESHWQIERRKALFNKDHAAWEKALIEEQMIFYGAMGFSEEDVLRILHSKNSEEKECTSQSNSIFQPSKAFDCFMLLLLIGTIAFMVYIL